MDTRPLITTASACLLLLTAAGCLNSPRNGSSHTSKRDRIGFQGVSQGPNVVTSVRMKNFRTGAWSSIAQSATSASTPTEDEIGWDWYVFDTTVALSSSADLWKRASTVSGQRRLAAELKGTNNTDGDLYTFDVGASDCGEQYSDQGLISVIEHCRSAKSPSAEVFVPCGKRNQDCCAAYNITASAACDAGRLCDGYSRCTIASGGADQPCNGDGSCNAGELACVAGTCRDVTIERLPLLSLDLRVRTCSDASKFGGDADSNVWVDLGTGPFYIEVPGNELQPGRTETFGLSPDDIADVGDITELSMGVHTRDVCFDSVELLANGRTLFRKTWSPGKELWTRYPRNTDHFTIPRDELRTYWSTNVDEGLACQGPTRITGSQLSRRITGLIGHLLETSDEISGDFDSDGWLTLTRADDDTINVRANFDATKQVDPIGRITTEVDIGFSLSFACTGGAACTHDVTCAEVPQCQNSAVTIDMSSIDVDVHGDWGYDVVNVLTRGVVDFFVDVEARTTLNEQAGGLVEALDDALTGLDACPAITVGTASPPDVSFGYPTVCLLGQITAADVDVCQ